MQDKEQTSATIIKVQKVWATPQVWVLDTVEGGGPFGGHERHTPNQNRVDTSQGSPNVLAAHLLWESYQS
jgi:hypothetical protein